MSLHSCFQPASLTPNPAPLHTCQKGFYKWTKIDECLQVIDGHTAPYFSSFADHMHRPVLLASRATPLPPSLPPLQIQRRVVGLGMQRVGHLHWPESLPQHHTPSIAFRHPPPNSARFSYAIEGALFISAQLSSDAVSALRKVRVLI